MSERSVNEFDEQDDVDDHEDVVEDVESEDQAMGFDPAADVDAADAESSDAESSQDAMGFDDIELAYREALKSINEAEQQVGNAFMDLAEADAAETDTEPAAFTSIGEELAEDLEAAKTQAAELEVAFESDTERMTPRCVIEGALFVGGPVALTARKLASLIGQETDARVAARLIDQLNEDYVAENRPYEIRLHEGGFQLQLREEFSEMQVKVFGLGPREVKLSPEVLELLSFVAYNQPITQIDLSNIKHEKVNSHLRQLIRLQLVEVERTGSKRSEVQYVTGRRFLRLFELDSLDDLPQADVFSFK